jgi:adenylate cyclase
MVICQAVYNTLLGSDRQRLHSTIADILTEEYAGTSDAAPDVIAEHLRKARRSAESIRLRLAASADTAARGAYVEAEGHSSAALALVDKVADPAERRMLQFRSLIQLGVALSGRHGYSATAVEDVYRRALAVCGDSGEAEMLYPIMRGQTVVKLLRGDLPTAYDLSIQSFQLAEQSRRVEFVIDGMSLLCYTALYYRSLAESRDWIERCLKLYREEEGHNLSYPVPQDPAAAALALLPTVAWLLGDSQGCEQAVLDGIEHVERLGHDFNRAFMHAWIAGTRYTQRRYADALGHAGTAVALGQRHGFREWEATGGLLALLAQAALAPEPEAVATATAACAAFAAEGVGLNASWYLWGLAGSYVKLGDEATARALLAEASRRAAASGETRMDAELLILEAEIEADRARAVRLLDEAAAIADGQGAVATALRALALGSLRAEEESPLAREALDTLDGRLPYPASPGWMADMASALRKPPPGARLSRQRHP